MTDITENDLDEEDAGPQPRVTDAPMEIWLQYGDELLVDTPHSTLARDGEVSWCDSQVFPFDVKYVRSDEVDRLRARVAELESLDRGGWVRTCGADHVVVPRDPTPEMLRAGFLSHHEDFEIDQPADAPGLVYKAMIDAAIDAAKDGA